MVKLPLQDSEYLENKIRNLSFLLDDCCNDSEREIIQKEIGFYEEYLEIVKPSN